MIAISRKLLTAIWHILSKNEAYNAELYRQADKPPATREITTEQALTFLRNKGFLVVDEGIRAYSLSYAYGAFLTILFIFEVPRRLPYTFYYPQLLPKRLYGC